MTLGDTERRVRGASVARPLSVLWCLAKAIEGLLPCWGMDRSKPVELHRFARPFCSLCQAAVGTPARTWRVRGASVARPFSVSPCGPDWSLERTGLSPLRTELSPLRTGLSKGFAIVFLWLLLRFAKLQLRTGSGLVRSAPD